MVVFFLNPNYTTGEKRKIDADSFSNPKNTTGEEDRSKTGVQWYQGEEKSWRVFWSFRGLVCFCGGAEALYYGSDLVSWCVVVDRWKIEINEK